MQHTNFWQGDVESQNENEGNGGKRGTGKTEQCIRLIILSLARMKMPKLVKSEVEKENRRMGKKYHNTWTDEL